MKRWPLGLALVVLAASMAGFAAVYLHKTDGLWLYALDDAYIGFATAKNLAEHGVWGATRYAFSGAATSLLWTVLLAAIERVIGLHATTAFVVNAVCIAGVVAVAQRVVAESIHDARWRAAALLVLVLAVPLPAIPFIGMEHGLQCLLVLLMAATGARAAATPPGALRVRLVTIAAAASALAVATRYDTASVVAGLVVVVGVTVGWRAALAIAAAAVAPMAPYALLARQHGWPMVPVAIVQKSRLFDLHFSAGSALAGAVETAKVALHAPAVAVLVVAAAALLVVTGQSRDATERRAWLVIFLVAALLHLQFGRIEWPHRYEMYLMTLGMVAVLRALPVVAWRIQPPASALLAGAGIVMLLLLGSRAATVHYHIVEAVQFFYAHEYQQGMFLREYRPDAPVMINDLGGPSFYSDARLVDLGALASLDVSQRLAGGQPLTVGLMRELAATNGVGVAMDLDKMPVPPEWTPVGEWNSDRGHTTFFAVDPSLAPGLRRSLQDYATKLPRNVRLKLTAD